MRIILDNQTLSETAPDLRQAIDLAKSHCAGSNRLVTDVSVDGRRLSDQELQAVEAVDVRPDSTVTCTSAETGELLLDTFDCIKEALSQIHALQTNVAQALQAGQTAEGMKALSDYFSLWAQVRQGIADSSVLQGVDLTKLEYDGIHAESAIRQLADRLTEVKDYVQNGDWVALADCLEYEMPDVVVQWRSIVDGLTHHLQSAD